MKKNASIIIVIILAIVLLSGCQTNNIVVNKEAKKEVEKLSSEEKEQKYREAVFAIYNKSRGNPMENDEFLKSKTFLESSGGYLDSVYLIEFIKALEEIEKPKPDYSLILTSLDKIPKDYKGDSSTEIDTFRWYYYDKFELQQYILSQGYLVENLSDYKGIKIRTKGYVGDSEIESILQKNNLQYKFLNDDHNSQLLYVVPDKVVMLFEGAYVLSVIQIKDSSGNTLDASAVLAEYAKQRTIRRKKEWEEIWAEQEKNTVRTPQKPRIGMTANEVLSTSWGKPEDVNRTTTAFSVKEQWVYGNGRYVYLTDGIVDAIQD